MLSVFTICKNKDAQNLLEVMDMFITLIVGMMSQVHAYISKLIKMHTLNMCIFIYKVHLNLT